jgi:hypothetical protein
MHTRQPTLALGIFHCLGIVYSLILMIILCLRCRFWRRLFIIGSVDSYKLNLKGEVHWSWTRRGGEKEREREGEREGAAGGLLDNN